MEVRLDSLIEKIRQEGVLEAKKRSEEIINKAKEEASLIIEKARAESQEIIDLAKKEAEKVRKNAQLSLQQATRDLILSLKEKIQVLLENILKREISSLLETEFLSELILKIVETWASGEKIECVVNPQQIDKLKSLVFSRLREELKEGVVIKTSPRVTRGLRVKLEKEEVYYDLTEEGIFQMLKEFLSPRLVEIIESQDG